MLPNITSSLTFFSCLPLHPDNRNRVNNTIIKSKGSPKLQTVCKHKFYSWGFHQPHAVLNGRYDIFGLHVLAATILLAVKSHTGQRKSLSCYKCTPSWQKLLSPPPSGLPQPYHTRKYLTLVASTEAATSVIFKNQNKSPPSKKFQEVKSSRVISFLHILHLIHWRTLCISTGFISENKVCKHWQSLLSPETSVTKITLVLWKHYFTPKTNTRPLLNLALPLLIKVHPTFGNKDSWIHISPFLPTKVFIA